MSGVALSTGQRAQDSTEIHYRKEVGREVPSKKTTHFEKEIRK